MTRNQRYETSMKSKGLKKVTRWVPEDRLTEVDEMLQFLLENKEAIPYMAKSLKTGRFMKMS